MTNEKKILIDEFLKTFDYNCHFENEDFIYWIREYHCYNGKSMNREEFEHVKNYAIKYGTLPFLIIKEREEAAKKEKEAAKKEKEIKSLDEKNLTSKSVEAADFNMYYYTDTYCRQKILRYSKKYDNLDCYYFDIDLRAPNRIKSNRILVYSNKRKSFSVNQKNHVLINGKRWLSLKNIAGFIGKTKDVTQKFGLMLLHTTLGGDKDWILKFEDTQSYLISNKSSRLAKSLEEAVEIECGVKPAKTIKKVIGDDINEIVNFYKVIDKNKIHYITNFIKRNHTTLEELLKQKSYSISSELLYYYFLTKDNRCDKHVLADYIRMLTQENKKINLNISSYKTLKNKHDELSMEILQRNKDNRRIRVSKIYPNIESIPGIEVEMIKNADRLNLESKMLGHCVHGYKTSINNGTCAIYSLVHNGERYTLEVKATKKIEEEKELHELKVNQLKGKYNCQPPLSMKEHFENMCKNHNLILEDKIKFIDKLIEDKSEVIVESKIQQIGEKILERLLPKIKSIRLEQDLELEDLPF